MLDAEQDARRCKASADGWRGRRIPRRRHRRVPLPAGRASVFTFLEVNTRLQVEHPVTEVTTGLDLVKLQILVAGGGRLDGEPPGRVRPRRRGPAQRRGRRPRLRARARAGSRCCALPTGPGIRVDTGVAQGDVIPPDYDSMIAKVIAWGRDRDEALRGCAAPCARPPSSSTAARPTSRFLLDLLDRPEVRRRHGRHRLARPRCARRGGLVADRARRHRAGRGRDRRRTRPRRRRTGAFLRLRPRRPPAGQHDDRPRR